jgi:hypothetical protein
MSGSTSRWLSSAVLTLDRWLCRRQQVYEFTDDPQCLFRIQCVCSEDSVYLADGTCVHIGQPVLALHLWNGHVPRISRHGPDLAWAHRADRAVGHSLRALARYLKEHPQLDDIVAIRGDMLLGGTRQGKQFKRIAARHGFESMNQGAKPSGALHLLGDTILVAMLVSATNPRALRSAPLRLARTRIWLSRTALEKYLD